MNATTEPQRIKPGPGTCIATLITELLGAKDPAAIDAAASMLQVAIGIAGEDLATDAIAAAARPFTALLARILREIAEIRSIGSEGRRDQRLASLRASSDWPGCIPKSRIAKLLQSQTNQSNCRRCGRPIWYVRSRSGAAMPITDEAISHFADCPHAAEFRRRKAAAEKGGQQP